MEKSQEVTFKCYANGEFTQNSAPLPYEQAVTLIVNGKAWMEMICTPSLVVELAVGFLYNERLIDSKAEITRLYVCDTADYVEVETLEEIKKPTTWVKTTGAAGSLHPGGWLFDLLQGFNLHIIGGVTDVEPGDFRLGVDQALVVQEPDRQLYH